MLRHPTEDRFYAEEFLAALELNKLRLADGVRTDSKYGIVGAAQKKGEGDGLPPGATNTPRS
jgi:hypothetical protein